MIIYLMQKIRQNSIFIHDKKKIPQQTRNRGKLRQPDKGLSCLMVKDAMLYF